MKVVVFGGGKGQSALLKGLKLIDELELSAIVTVADDGGSTGRLREEFNLPAMGDIRNVMLSLAESETLLSKIMNYRFNSKENGDLHGHNLGNLILTAMVDASGDFIEAITLLSEVLNVKGTIIPSSTDLITLCARMEDGTIVRGESNIPKYRNAIECVYYDRDVQATQNALDAIAQADVILMGVGSLYTSILPNLIVPEIGAALKMSTAKKIYYCNVMSQPGETDGFSAEDHVNALLMHCDIKLDAVVCASDVIAESTLSLYREEGSYPVVLKEHDHDYKIIYQSLIETEDGRIRHSPQKVSKGIYEVLELVGCPLAVK